MAEQQAKMMERLLSGYKPVEISRMATSTAGEPFRMSGLYNPHPGDLAVDQEGDYADPLLVDGNPLQDLKMVTGADQGSAGILPRHRGSDQWDHAFGDGAKFKHGNMGQGNYVDKVTGPDLGPGYPRAAAKMLAGG